MNKEQLKPQDQLQGKDVEISGSGWAVMEKTWERVQAKAFTKWVASYLIRRNIKIENLAEEFTDGIKLVQFLEIISNQKAPGKLTNNPRMRIQKIQNCNLAMQFIKLIGVNLIAIQAEDVVDGNQKLILGMIWTIIQKFTIDDISEDEMSSKEALLLWAKKKTKGYPHVNVQNLHTSFQDGLAFCALIHAHRPDLLDFNKLDPNNPRENLKTAFEVAEKSLGIPQLLDVDDMLESPKPDERAVILYLSQYYHAFAGQKKAGEASDTIGRIIDSRSANEKLKNDYERRAKELKHWIDTSDKNMKDRTTDGTIEDINKKLHELDDHKSKDKPPKAAEKLDLESLLNTLQMKLKNSNSTAYVPPDGLKTTDIEKEWGTLGQDEKDRENWLRDMLRKAQQQDQLKNRFGDKAAALEKWIENKQDYLKRPEEVDSLESAKSKLQTCEAFTQEHDQSRKNLDEVNELAKDLINGNHPEKDQIKNRNDDINKNWNGLKDLHKQKLEDLRKKLAHEQLKEDTRLAFAKAAKEYANWVKKSQNDFIGEDFGESLDEVQAYKNKLDNSDKEFNQSNDSKKQHLDDLWKKLQELGVTENRHTNYTNDDIAKLHNDLKGGLEKRQAAYKEELERQIKMEALCKKFAELADKFNKSIEQRQSEVTSLQGEPDDLIPKVSEKYADGKPEAEQLEEISKLAAEMSKLGISKNKHTKFTLADLKVADKNFGRWARNYIYQLGQERDLKAEYGKRAKAFVEWCEKTLPTLDKSNEFDGTLAGIRNLQQKWNVYKTSDSAEQEIEKDTLHNLENRIASILQSTKRPAWNPPTEINHDKLNEKWGHIQTQEKKTDEAINKELERQENLALLIRRFNNDHDDVHNFIKEKEKFFNEQPEVKTLRDARLQSKLLQINLEEVSFKQKRLDGLKQIRQEIAEQKYPEIGTIDNQLKNLEEQWKNLTNRGEEKKKGFAGTLNSEEGKEKLRTDFAETAKDFQRYVHDTVDAVNDHNFGNSSDTVKAFKTELDKNDQEVLKNLEEKKQKAQHLDKELKSQGVTDNKYTNLSFGDLEKQEQQLKDAIVQRQKAYTVELQKQETHDVKRKSFAEKAKKFIAFVQEKKELFEKLEGSPEEKIQRVQQEYQNGEPNKVMVAEIEQIATEMANEGIHGNAFTSVSLPTVQSRNTQYNNSVSNFLSGLQEEKEFEERLKKKESQYKKKEQLQALSIEYNTKANIFKLWVIESNGFLTGTIVASSVTDVKDLQQNVHNFEEKQLSSNKTIYEQLVSLDKQLKEFGDNSSNISDVTSDWEGIHKALKERKNELAEEEKKQSENDVLRKEFASVAKTFSEWIESQNKALSVENGSLEDQLGYLSKLSEKVASEGNKNHEGVLAVNQKLVNAHITSNAFTTHTHATLTSEFNALKEAVSKRQSVVDQEILRKKGQDITPEELKEYKEVFQHFDKDSKNSLDKLKFKAVLQTLGEEVEDEAINKIIQEIDTTRKDGCVSFDEFVSYMESRKKKTDSKSHIIESFKSIAGDKDFITSSDLYAVLPKEKVEYLLTQMPHYKDMQDGYDYIQWANNSFN